MKDPQSSLLPAVPFSMGRVLQAALLRLCHASMATVAGEARGSQGQAVSILDMGTRNVTASRAPIIDEKTEAQGGNCLVKAPKPVSGPAKGKP